MTDKIKNKYKQINIEKSGATPYNVKGEASLNRYFFMLQ